jgi:hypothetical protein
VATGERQDIDAVTAMPAPLFGPLPVTARKIGFYEKDVHGGSYLFEKISVEVTKYLSDWGRKRKFVR